MLETYVNNWSKFSGIHPVVQNSAASATLGQWSPPQSVFIYTGKFSAHGWMEGCLQDQIPSGQEARSKAQLMQKMWLWLLCGKQQHCSWLAPGSRQDVGSSLWNPHSWGWLQHLCFSVCLLWGAGTKCASQAPIAQVHFFFFSVLWYVLTKLAWNSLSNPERLWTFKVLNISLLHS